MNDNSYELVSLISSDELKTRFEGIVDEIRDIMPTDNLVIVALLKGSFVFLADLIRLLCRHNIHMEIDFMAIGSYGDNSKSSGNVILKRDIETAGRQSADRVEKHADEGIGDHAWNAPGVNPLE